MNTFSLRRQGYGPQLTKLYEQLGRNFVKRRKQIALEIYENTGALVDLSFWDVYEPYFSKDDMIQALADLGVYCNHIEGKKWYQFWLSNKSVKIKKGIKLL